MFDSVVYPTIAAVKVYPQNVAAVVDARNAADGSAVDPVIFGIVVLLVPTAKPILGNELFFSIEYAEICSQVDLRRDNLAFVVSGDAADGDHILFGHNVVHIFIFLIAVGVMARHDAVPVAYRHGYVLDNAGIVSGDDAHNGIAGILRDSDMIVCVALVAVAV